MQKANQDIRERAKACGVYLWQIAEKYGVTHTTFCCKMRKEFSLEEKKRIFKMISEIQKENE